jgi:hypothetical protein
MTWLTIFWSGAKKQQGIASRARSPLEGQAAVPGAARESAAVTPLEDGVAEELLGLFYQAEAAVVIA